MFFTLTLGNGASSVGAAAADALVAGGATSAAADAEGAAGTAEDNASTFDCAGGGATAVEFANAVVDAAAPALDAAAEPSGADAPEQAPKPTKTVNAPITYWARKNVAMKFTFRFLIIISSFRVRLYCSELFDRLIVLVERLAKGMTTSTFGHEK